MNSPQNLFVRERRARIMNMILAAILAAPLLAGGAKIDKEAKKVVEEFRSLYFLKIYFDSSLDRQSFI